MTIMPVPKPQTGFKTAGTYMGAFSSIPGLFGSEEYKNASPEEKAWLRESYNKQLDPDAKLTEYIGGMLEQNRWMNTPEGRKQLLDQQLAFDKARGEQQMKYRMTNDIIGNLGQAARAAFGGYGVSPDYLGQAVGNVGNAYLAGLQAVPRVAPQVGQRYF